MPALHELDCDQAGFEWVITHDSANNVFAWLRKGYDAHARCLVVVNFSPNVYHDYRVRVPFAGKWRKCSIPTPRIMAAAMSAMSARSTPLEGSIPELSLTIPPLAAIFLVPES